VIHEFIGLHGVLESGLEDRVLGLGRGREAIYIF
jgi:hypothetical protein